MIKSNGAVVEINGSKILLHTEFIQIARVLYKHHVLTKDDLELSVQLATMNEEELDEAVEKAHKQVLDGIDSMDNISEALQILAQLMILGGDLK